MYPGARVLGRYSRRPGLDNPHPPSYLSCAEARLRILDRSPRESIPLAPRGGSRRDPPGGILFFSPEGDINVYTRDA